MSAGPRSWTWTLGSESSRPYLGIRRGLIIRVCVLSACLPVCLFSLAG